MTHHRIRHILVPDPDRAPDLAREAARIDALEARLRAGVRAWRPAQAAIEIGLVIGIAITILAPAAVTLARHALAHHAWAGLAGSLLP